ncbi:hypothetical protein QYF61_021023 [Mycteria americana]|uniref:Uncharacterized protein n=1 Tax=Mycteria americana TaxID=33587 RepID=A0AAN7PL00_MYCAM|nr:hypothetical protein QYF61_021023 [Mycteria americana]
MKVREPDSVVPRDRTRGNGHELKNLKFNLNTRKDFFFCDNDQTVEQAAQRRCGVSICVHIQNTTGHGLGQPAAQTCTSKKEAPCVKKRRNRTKRRHQYVTPAPARLRCAGREETVPNNRSVRRENGNQQQDNRRQEGELRLGTSEAACDPVRQEANPRAWGRPRVGHGRAARSLPAAGRAGPAAA